LTATAPTTAIGYTQAINQYWWLYENETTPELVWPQSVYVYDQMRRTDSQVGSILRAVTLLVLRTTWRVDPNGARDEVTQFVADDLGLPVVGQDPRPAPRTRDRFSWSQHLAESLLMLPMGHAYFEQVYRVESDGSRAHLGKLELRPSKTIAAIDVARDGGLVSITQHWVSTEDRPRPIPVDRLVAYIHAKEGGNWLGTSLLRNCYKNWLLKDRLLRVQAQTIERNGMGIPLYKAQEGASEPDLAAGKAMAMAWRAGEAAGSAVPFGADLVLRGVEGTLPDAEPAVRYHDESIAKTVLAHFLNLGQQTGTGSWALGTTFADFFTLGVQTVAQQIADVANMHVVEDLVDVNFGEDEPAPRICFDEIGARQAATAAAIKTLVDAGVIQPDEVLETSSRQQYGLPPKDPDTVRGAPGQPPPDTSGGIQPYTSGPDTSGGGGGGTPTPTGTYSVAAAAGDLPKGDGPEPPDEAADFDDLVDALVAALAEFTGEIAAAAGANFDALHPRGPGGRFRNVIDRIMTALDAWSRGDGANDPLPESMFSREHLREAAKARGLTLKRGASREAIHDQLLADVKAKVRTARDAKAPEAGKPVRFTLKGKSHANVDVGVFREGGKVGLWEVSDSGERRKRVALVDDLAGLRAWAESNGEPELAAWARKEQGAPDGLDDLGNGGLADLAAEHGIDVPSPLRDSDREAAIAKLRGAGVKAPDSGGGAPAPTPKTAPDDKDMALLREIEKTGFAQAGGTTTGAARQRTARLDDLKRQGLVARNGNTYTLTDAGRESARKEQGGKPGAPAKPSKLTVGVVGRDLTNDHAAVAAAFEVGKEDGEWGPSGFGAGGQGGGRFEPDQGGYQAHLTLAKQQGFDGPPRVVRADGRRGSNGEVAEWNKLENAGWRPMYRGWGWGQGEKPGKTGQDMAHQFLYGPLHVGGGVGLGTNMSDDLDAADYYARQDRFTRIPGSATVAFLLSPDAKVIKYPDAVKQRDDYLANLPAGSRYDAERKVFEDPGTFAMASGYDAMVATHDDHKIVKRGTEEWVVFNRTKLAAFENHPEAADAWKAAHKNLNAGAPVPAKVAKAVPAKAPAKATHLVGRPAQDSAPVRWDYNSRALSAGLDGWSPQDRARATRALHNWVFDKVSYDRSRAGESTDSSPEPKVNAALRGKVPMTEQLRTDIETLDRVLEASPLPKPIVAYRGFVDSQGILPEGWQDRDLAGLTWSNKAFTSVTVNRDAAETYSGYPKDGGFAFRLRLPAGSRAVAVQDEPGGLDDEGELILPRDLSFRVVKDNGVQGDYGIRWLDVEAVPAGTTVATKATKKAAPVKAPATPATGLEPPEGMPPSAVARYVDQQPTSVVPLAGGHTSTGNDLVTYSDGTRLVHKTYQGVDAEHARDAEVLGSLLAQASGVRSPGTAIGRDGSVWMEFVDGQRGTDILGDTLQVPRGILDSPDGRRLGIADTLMGTGDRSNPGNWLRTPDGRLVALDHGAAFLGSGDLVSTGPFGRRFRDSPSYASGRLKPGSITRDEYADIRPRLDALRPEFERLGRGDWWDTASERLDTLAGPTAGPTPAKRAAKKATAARPTLAEESVAMQQALQKQRELEIAAGVRRDPVADTLAVLRGLDTEARRDALDLHKVDELKAMLREAGLPVSGRKRDLVDRLVAHHEGGGPTAPSTSGGLTQRVVGRDISSEVDYAALPTEYNLATNHDDALREILRTQGFDAKPDVVSKADFDAAVKRGEVRETWRGLTTSPFSDLTPEQMAEAYRSGDLRPGTGINGNGTYVAVRRADGQYYGSTLLRIGLRRDARVISANDLDAEMDAYFTASKAQTAQHQSLQRRMLAELAKAKSERARANIRRRYRAESYGPDRSSRVLAIQRDPGRFAALRGYDAIDIPKERSPDKHAEVIILNRAATIVEAAQ
jgi:hypothetical protein